jgi:hypothetical protein
MGLVFTKRKGGCLYNNTVKMNCVSAVMSFEDLVDSTG